MEVGDSDLPISCNNSLAFCPKFPEKITHTYITCKSRNLGMERGKQGKQVPAPRFVD